jgi:uncharacterized protein DUF4249
VGFLGLILFSCEEVIGIDPGISTEAILVVEGGITTQPPPYKISLRTAQNISGIGKNTLGIGAKLTLYDQNGASEQLIEDTPGNYLTAGGQITGQVGESYKLAIELANGEQYESDYDLIPSPVVVADIYQELVEVPILNSEQVEIGKTFIHKIYTNIENDDNRNVYIKSTQQRAIIESMIGLETGCEDFGPPVCYAFKDVIVSDIFLTSNLEKGTATLNLEIAQVAIDFKGLYYTSFTIESISPLAFDYYTAIKQQLNAPGTIFDPFIPKVPTNIHGINGTERASEGYFRAYSISVAEICYDRADAKVTINIPVPSSCEFCFQFFSPATPFLPPEMQNCQ